MVKHGHVALVSVGYMADYLMELQEYHWQKVDSQFGVKV